MGEEKKLYVAILECAANERAVFVCHFNQPITAHSPMSNAHHLIGSIVVSQ